MNNELILFTISVLPVVLIGLYIHKKDINKEPKRLLGKLFFGGIAACFLSLVMTTILSIVIPFFGRETNTLESFELIIYVFVGVALIEEISKWIMAYKISYYDDAFDELYDMILYCMFVALGFACFENLFYVYELGIEAGIFRAISAIPSHACDGFFMGYFLGLSKIYLINNQYNLKKKYMFLSILVPTIMHGIYDYCLFRGTVLSLIIFFAFVLSTFIYTVKKINHISQNNIRFR